MSRINFLLKRIRFFLRNGKCDVRFTDFGTTYLRICKGSIIGQGCLNVNKNAVSKKECSKFRIDKGGRLLIHGNVSFYPKCNIHILENGILEIFDGTYFNEGTKISIKTRCVIGKKCAISNDVTIMDSDFHTILGEKKDETGIEIGNHVWLGANCTVLKNVVIGNDAVIGANTVVTKNISNNSLAVGNPAKIIKTDISWK